MREQDMVTIITGILEKLDKLQEKTDNIETRMFSDPSMPTVEKISTKLALQLQKLEKGEDGKDGEPGVNGMDGMPGERGEDGKDGKDGRPGKDGLDGKDGRDGRDGRDGTDGIDGKDGSPDTPDQVIEKVNSSSLVIKKERVEGLLDALYNIAHQGVAATTNFFNGLRAKNLDIVGTGSATVTSKQVGDKVTITINTSAGTGSTFYAEQLTDSGDHQNFTTLNTINSVMSLMDGQGKGIPNNLYSTATNTLTLTSADAYTASIGLFIIYT